MIYGHTMTGEWALPGMPDICINMQEVFDFISLTNPITAEVNINDIAYKDLSNIDIDSLRYKKANTRFPGIAIKGMSNPLDKKYRLIDGRHRLLKTIANNSDVFRVYILKESDIERFYYYV